MIKFWLCFVPLFVATDAIGTLPLFVGMTEGLKKAQVKRIIVQSVLVAMVVTLLFLVAGRTVLQWLGITVADFMIAGGALLFIISVSGLLGTQKAADEVDAETMGAVPLGVPLIAGPAVLATILLLLNEHGIAPTAFAIYVNIIVAGGVFFLSGPIIRALGRTGAKTISKLASLLLAAIAVMMIRRGIVAIILGLPPAT